MRIPLSADEKVKVSYDTVCSITDKPIHREVKPSMITVYKLSSIYDDVDDGCEWVDSFRCEHCDQYHEVTLYKDRPIGA